MCHLTTRQQTRGSIPARKTNTHGSLHWGIIHSSADCLHHPYQRSSADWKHYSQQRGHEALNAVIAAALRAMRHRMLLLLPPRGPYEATRLTAT
eukprot:120296-Chlamydomonas_euryale.AAC.1